MEDVKVKLKKIQKYDDVLGHFFEKETSGFTGMSSILYWKTTYK